jgi:hypothetical protein
LLVLLPARDLSAQSSWFSLTLPWDDSSKTYIDASDLLVDYPGQDPCGVIDARGYLRAGPDGHFYFEKTGKRARFWGVNLTFNADFPPCIDESLRAGEFPDQWAADKLARRLAKLGVNVVRFHHMDTLASPSGIWDNRYYPNDTQHLDPGQLKRLDYLIYQLRLNGIYVNLNLKVGRHFGKGDGILNPQMFTGGLAYYQGVDNFDPRMIELQRDYARQLLAHRNPYTGQTYIEDPVIAFVEIANEDSLFGNLLREGGLNYVQDTSGTLPEYYSKELDSQWNRWLADHYSNRSALDTAWKSNEPPADTSDKIRNGGFENGTSEWSIYPIGNARANARVEAGAGPDKSAALRVDITSDGTNWHVQCIQNGLAIEKDKSYEISFYARAALPGEITMDVMKGVAPWNNYGLSKTVQLTTSWQQYTGRFRANGTDRSTVRPTFELGAMDNTVWIDKVEFRQVVPKELGADESFEAGTVVRPMRSDLGTYTPARITDLFRFYSAAVENYFVGMRRFLKEDLGVQGLVTGTAPWWAYLGDVAIQSKMDYVDGHYYWDHPWWPTGKEWSPTGWQISNKPWINDLQELSGLASQAVEGKPFTVSEFNEVFPNRYAHEGQLLMALVGNLQDWDAVYMFDFAGNASQYDETYTSSFFDLAGNPTKTGQLPIASRIFLRRQSAVAPTTVGVELNRDELALGYAKGLINASGFLESKGLDSRTFLRERLRMVSFDRTDPVSIDHSLPSGSVTASNGELLWNRENPEASFMRVTGSSVQGAIGFLKGGIVDLGDWSFRVGDASPDHLAVLLQSRDIASLRETRHMILSVWTEYQNTGMLWNDSQTSVDNRWGHDPALVRVAQLDVTMRFPAARKISIYPLDEKGNRKSALSLHSIDSGTTVQIDASRDNAVWYEIELNSDTDSADYSVPANGIFQLYTDPSLDPQQVGWLQIENSNGGPVRPTALLEYSTRGVLTSMVRLPPSSPTVLARAPVIHNAQVDTAIAVLNRQPSPNRIMLRLLDSSGASAGESPVDLNSGEAKAFFLREKFNLQASFDGLLELKADAPFHTITLRSTNNAGGDFSLTPYPQESATSGPLYFTHLTADPSYSSDIVLWNSQDKPVTARLEFFNPTGQPTAPPNQPASADVSLLSGQLRRMTIPQSSASFYGYARLTLRSGTALPSATAVITRWENGAPVSEAGIPGTPALAEDTLLVAERPSQQTALALLNPSAQAATVGLQILGAEGSTPVPGKVQIRLQPGEKRAFFLYEVFSGMPPYLNSMLHIKADSSIAMLELLGLVNERGNFLIAALTGEAVHSPLAAGGIAVVPRFATGAGYRTLLYLLPDETGGSPSQGKIRFLDSSGTPQRLFFR